MSQHSLMLSILTQKLQWIKDQTNQLHKVADNLCNKVVEETTEVLKTTNINKNELRGINLRLDGLFDFLAEKCKVIDDAANNDGVFESEKFINVVCEPETTSLKMNQRYSEVDIIKMVNRIEVLEEAVSSLRSGQQRILMSQDESEKQLTTKFHGIETEFQHIQERLKSFEAMGKQISTNLAPLISVPTTLNNLQTETQEMARNIEQHKAKLTHLLQLCVGIQKNKTSIKALVFKIKGIDDSLSDLSACRNNELERLSNIDNELTAVNTFISKNKTDLDQRFKEISEQYEMMKHILLKKIANLEKLRVILNLKSQSKRSEKTLLQKLWREELQCEDSPLICELRLIKQQLLDLQNRCIFAPVGFTAYLHGTLAVKKGGFLTSFLKNVTFNPGNHFDLDTCRFTAPVDGMYLIALTLWQRAKGKIGVNIEKSLHYPGNLSGTEKPDIVGKVYTEASDTSSCGVCLTHMREGDTIDVRIIIVEDKPLLSSATCLTCFLV